MSRRSRSCLRCLHAFYERDDPGQSGVARALETAQAEDQTALELLKDAQARNDDDQHYDRGNKKFRHGVIQEDRDCAPTDTLANH